MNIVTINYQNRCVSIRSRSSSEPGLQRCVEGAGWDGMAWRNFVVNPRKGYFNHGNIMGYIYIYDYIIIYSYLYIVIYGYL